MSGHGDLLEKLMTQPGAGKKVAVPAPAKVEPPPPPATYVPPPGWSIGQVQADSKENYVPPPGWHAAGQPTAPPPQPGQQDAVSTYVPPAGWTPAPQLGAAPSAPVAPQGHPIVSNVIANNGQALNASTLAALRARFGG